MINLIENLQKKSKNYRRRLAFVFSLSFTFVIIIFWLVALFGGGNSSLGEKSISNTASPFASIKSSVSHNFNQTKALFSDFNQSKENGQNI